MAFPYISSSFFLSYHSNNQESYLSFINSQCLAILCILYKLVVESRAGILSRSDFAPPSPAPRGSMWHCLFDLHNTEMILASSKQKPEMPLYIWENRRILWSLLSTTRNDLA